MKIGKTLPVLALSALLMISGCTKPQAKPPASNELPAADVQDEQPIADAQNEPSPEAVQKTEPPAEIEEDPTVGDAPFVESEGEAVYCVFPDVEALTDAVHAEQNAHWKNAAALSNRLEDVDEVYVPVEEYEGFRLLQVAVNPYYIFSYYVPLDSDFDMVFDPEDIVITQSRSPKMTLESVCAQHGISPDADGYAYSEKHGDLFFEQDGNVIFISGPEGRNDYGSLRALCRLKRVDIARSYPTQNADFEKYGDAALKVALLGEENAFAYEKAVAALGLSASEAARQYCTALTELGDGAGWTEVERVKGDDGVYYLAVARLRTFCYDDTMQTLAGKVGSQYGRFRDGDRRVLGPGPGPGQSREDEELIYDLTGLTAFHPALTGASLHVTVNGIDCGAFALADGEGCTLIPLDLPEFVADGPVRVVMRLADAPPETEIEVYPGLGSNVSRAI